MITQLTPHGDRLRRGALVLVCVTVLALAGVFAALPRAAAAGSGGRLCSACDAIRATGPDAAGTTPKGYTPKALAAKYHLPGLGTGGAATTIAVLGAGVDPKLAADLSTYRSTFGLPPCTVASGCLQLLGYRGGAQPAAAKANPFLQEQLAGETSLDVDMVSAACPTCHIIDVAVPWQDGEDDNDVSTGDFAHAADTAVAAGAQVISVSYGYTPDVNNVAGRWAAAFAHPGVAVVASSGDNGFTGGVHASWPATLPTVTAAGGVTLPRTGAASAWDEAGSGCEQLVPAAEGQPSDVTDRCNGHRAVSDVSADADPQTGVAVYDSYWPYSHHSGRWDKYGGTSASAPYIAGLYGRVGNTSSVDGPNTVYAAADSAFTDVTKGGTFGYPPCHTFPGVDRSLCHAGPGWDGPTGRGIPDGLTAF